MNIGIDARMYGPKQGGLGRYVAQLVDVLLEAGHDHEYVLFVLPGVHISKRPNVRLVEVDVPWYGWKEQLLLPWIIKRERVDLMHFPHWNVPLLYHDPYVVTVHDLIMYHFPRQEASTLGPVWYWVKDKLSRLVVHHAVHAAKHLFVTSEFTKQDVHKTLRVPLEKMTVTYQSPTRNKEQGTRNKSALLKYGVTKPYVLYVGNAYPHKNLERLVEAWDLFQNNYSTDYQLVLVGKKNFFYERLLNSITTKQYSDIVFTDFVPDDELALFYENASLFVFPSLYEGFGLPPLEAMTYGVPVVSSNRSCLPEVLGDAALYFDPENVEEMADAMWRGVSDEGKPIPNNRQKLLSSYSLSTFIRSMLHVYITCAKT